MTSQYGQVTESTYEHAGFGAAFRRGVRPAVVVVDLTRGFTEAGFPTGSDLTETVAATGRLIEAARGAGAPVIFTAIAYSLAEVAGGMVIWLEKAPGMRALLQDSPSVDLDPRLPVEEGDLVILKKGPSAFFGTNLSATLTALGTDTVLLCGATTSGCLRATAVDAVQYGLPVLVPRECVGDRAKGPHDAALFDLQAKYADVIELTAALDYLATVAGRAVVPGAVRRPPWN